MKPFMNEDFLLATPTAQFLYHTYAEKMPIIDYHCHLNPEEIYTDKTFENITQLWLGGDHYKWRQMRSNGIDEYYITGDAPDKEKFQKWAETLSKCIGNPLHHWSHLELQRYFGYDGILNAETADTVWELCNAKLQDSSMSVRNLIKQSHVDIICTTDDPVDSLEWHQKLQGEACDFKVLPAWRPDKAMLIESPTFIDYIAQLSSVSQIDITDFTTLKAALTERIDFFHRMGCCISDHALEYVMYVPADEATIAAIFQKRLQQLPLSEKEVLQYKTAFMLFVAQAYHKHNWCMQLHYGCKRNNATLAFEQLGADTGFDCITNTASAAQLTDFLNHLDMQNSLPKVIIYSLNPNDNAMIGTILGCFQRPTTRGKIQQGSAWWFNDHKQGMIDQMLSLANLGVLSNFVGMLTDSRSFLSYTRHEYFRRILCNLIGQWVEDGEYPYDLPTLRTIIEGICYNNASHYFGFTPES